ncbi:MAG: hypothetical protein JO132_00050 [Streptosporangiaceae bacterium]|nr:hypothetical protein [Streptosporangiaceae bacterium]
MTNATTGSERVAPGQQPSEGQRRPLLSRLARPALAHWQFGLVLLAAVGVRIIVALGYPPILWFNDSYNYVQDAITHIPDEIRPNGYPFLLSLLEPLHSWRPVGLLQAAMGVGMGVAVYAVLRHRGLRWWGAALPALPVLFDSYELHLEHMVTADTLFVFLVTVALVILCWSDRPSVLAMAAAGLFIGYATMVRSVGEPLLAVVFVGMLARRAGWRRLLTLAVAGLIPIAGYMAWFHHFHGRYTLTESSGPFLYSRVSTFAECAKMTIPNDLRFLCDPISPKDRPPAGAYIWADNDLPVRGQITYTPLYNTLGSDTARRFTAVMNAETREFAERAIEAQPVAYLRVVAKDVLHTFGWNRQPDPNDWYGNGPVFRFVSGPEMTAQVPWFATPVRLNGTPRYHYCDARCQGVDHQAHQVQVAEKDFGGQSLGFTEAVQPWAGLIQAYQRYVYLRGTLLGIVVLIGAADAIARWRRLGGLVPLPWLVGVLLIVLPPMTAGFSYRYVLAAAPAACLAAGLAFVPDGTAGRGRSVPPGARASGKPLRGRSVRSLAADLRRHLGRRVGVEQE